MRPKKRRKKYGYYKQQKQLKRRYERYCKSYKKSIGNNPGPMTELMWAMITGYADAVQDPLVKRRIKDYQGVYISSAKITPTVREK